MLQSSQSIVALPHNNCVYHFSELLDERRGVFLPAFEKQGRNNATLASLRTAKDCMLRLYY